jgi:hypothetical protein
VDGRGPDFELDQTEREFLTSSCRIERSIWATNMGRDCQQFLP